MDETPLFINIYFLRKQLSKFGQLRSVLRHVVKKVHIIVILRIVIDGTKLPLMLVL